MDDILRECWKYVSLISIININTNMIFFYLSKNSIDDIADSHNFVIKEKKIIVVKWKLVFFVNGNRHLKNLIYIYIL